MGIFLPGMPRHAVNGLVYKWEDLSRLGSVPAESSPWGLLKQVCKFKGHRPNLPAAMVFFAKV